MSKNSSKTLIEVLELSEIVRTLGSKKILDWYDHSDSREARVCRRIVEKTRGMVRDEDVFTPLGMDERIFQRVLSNVKNMLLEAVQEIELPEDQYSEYARRLLVLDLSHARIRIIMRLGAAFTAAAESGKLYEEAKILEEWPTAISLATALLTWNALSGDKKNYDRIATEVGILRARALALDRANEMMDRVKIVFAKSGAEHPELLKIVRPAIRELTPIVQKHGTFRLQEALLMLRKKAEQVTTDYDEALAICDEMDRLLEAYPLFSNRSRKSRNALSRLLCTVQMKRYEDAKQIVSSSEDLFDSGGQDWYSFQVWRFLLLMHTKAFGAAYELDREILARHDFSTQTEVTRHLWRLFLGHAQFWTNRTVTDAKFKRNEKPGAIHERLMKQYPSFKGDYAGYELAAILLEILVLLNQSRSDLISRTESLLKYKTRHLGKEDVSRTNIFIDMMQLITLYDFDREKIVKAARPMLRRMSKIKTIDRMQAMQVLPYEMTWEAVEVRLKNVFLSA